MAWIKIKSAPIDQGGSPYRILSAEPTGYIDKYNNHSFNVEIEAAQSMDANRDHPVGNMFKASVQNAHAQAPQAPPARQNGDGVQQAREHLMRSANLLNLCIDCVEKVVWPHLVQYSIKDHESWLTAELYNAAIAKIYIEASDRRTTDGVNWWSFIDKMPNKPIK